eukprot:m.95984 g.95984  ORF g.95984 m.95984 type:complete len:79 (+) comp12346_c0_seq3:1080-1316(+)
MCSQTGGSQSYSLVFTTLLTVKDSTFVHIQCIHSAPEVAITTSTPDDQNTLLWTFRVVLGTQCSSVLQPRSEFSQSKG